MAFKIGINGFGRIGRMVCRIAIDKPEVDIVSVNASYPPSTLAHMLKYDSVHGKFNADISYDENSITVNGHKIICTAERDPLNIPWAELNVDIVVEATGKFKSHEQASMHLQSGAKKVLITSPGKNPDATIVMGVNDEIYDFDKHHIVSNASCTTNCLAPVAKVLNDKFGIVNGLMTTVHAFTNDQKNLDNPHKKDLRRARGCMQSIIPTTTGAAKSIGLLIPELQGKLNGFALRVPTPDVSLVDLVCEFEKEVTVESINATLKEASESYMKGYIGYSEEPLVSIDYCGCEISGVVDALSTMTMGKNMAKIIIWYDNEWGYSCRVVDLLLLMGSGYLK